MTTVKNIYDYINSIASFDSQEEWDNSGFLIGDFRKQVKTVVMSLDATKEVVQYAVSVNADLLITHHPVIFKGITEIIKGSSVYELVNNDVAVISAHTSFDKSCEGINFNLAKLLCLSNAFVLDNGFVVVGDLEQEMTIDDFVQLVSDSLDCRGIRYTDTEKYIKKVAVAGGACSEFIDDALNNADCFVTGDLKYHEMLDVKEKGGAVVSAGHFETENQPFLMLKDKLQELFTDVEFLSAPVENPVMGL